MKPPKLRLCLCKNTLKRSRSLSKNRRGDYIPYIHPSGSAFWQRQNGGRGGGWYPQYLPRRKRRHPEACKVWHPGWICGQVSFLRKQLRISLLPRRSQPFGRKQPLRYRYYFKLAFFLGIKLTQICWQVFGYSLKIKFTGNAITLWEKLTGVDWERLTVQLYKNGSIMWRLK